MIEHLTYSPHSSMDVAVAYHPSRLASIPWPDGVAPVAAGPIFGVTLPAADAVIVTWTVAEWEALTDVLDRGGTDVDYANEFASYEADLTDESPARDARCLARVRLVSCGAKAVLLVHSMLHVATDGPALPLRRLIDQIIDETGCSRLITTGTAGGIGVDKRLGDVVIADACRFNCRRQFAGAPFAQTAYPTTILGMPTTASPSELIAMLAANLGQLAAVRTAGPGELADPGTVVPIQVYSAGIETTDFFAFDASDDHFGLRTADPAAGAVEMDDAVLGLVIAGRLLSARPAPHWAAVRNVSDPQADLSRYATFEDAAADMGRVYRRYGYWTTVGSAVISWLLAVV